MKTIINLLLSLGLTCSSAAQPYNIGHRQVTFIDADRNDRPILTEIYYPSVTGGDNVPIAGENGTAFPLLVFGHGFVMEWGAYSNFWTNLVPQGYIMAFPRTETDLSPDHMTFGQDIAFLVKVIQQEGENPESPFFEKVDSTSCVMGHSMGGGSSFLSIQYNPSITAIVNFAAAETNPSAIAACSSISVPALVFAGGNDCITPPVTNQLLMYNSLASPCKTMIEIDGGSHCQFAEQNTLCSFGELTCQPAPDIERDYQHRMVDTLLGPWLDYYLKGNCSASTVFQDLLHSSFAWSYEQQCEPCTPLSASSEDKGQRFRLFPMPSTGNFYIETHLEIPQLIVRIYDVKGGLVFLDQIESGKGWCFEIQSHLSPGIYSVEIVQSEQVTILKLIVQ